MAQGSGPGATGQAVATEMIAQLAAQNPLAFETLIQMAQQEQISGRVWARLAPILAGDQYQIAKGGAPNVEGAPPSVEGDAAQNYAIVNTVTTPDQISQRIALIDRFLGQVPPNSTAAAALMHQRDMLAARLSN